MKYAKPQKLFSGLLLMQFLVPVSEGQILIRWIALWLFYIIIFALRLFDHTDGLAGIVLYLFALITCAQKVNKG